MASQPQHLNLLRYRLTPRTPTALFLASVVSGFTWYFANQQTKHFNEYQQELINRVEKDETAENFKENFNRFHVNDWDCKKVNLDGVIGQGRFFIKRNRGKQEGYLVLAPFIVQTLNNETNFESGETHKFMNINRKFIVNLGWIPRSRKHLVYTTVPTNFISEEIYTDRQEALQKQAKDGLIRDPLTPELTVPITNITAYIRKAEEQDKLVGRTNWKQNYLYKWINLKQLTRIFRVFNEQEGETIYLQRTTKTEDEPETIPVVASKQSMITDLKNESKNYEQNAKRFFWLTSGLSFGIASWITFL